MTEDLMYEYLLKIRKKYEFLLFEQNFLHELKPLDPNLREPWQFSILTWREIQVSDPTPKIWVVIKWDWLVIKNKREASKSTEKFTTTKDISSYK
jgi:hypothetical protein